MPYSSSRSPHSFFRHTAAIAALLLAPLLSLAAAAGQERWVDPARDLQLLPESGTLLTWRGDQQIVAYRNLGQLMPVRTVAAGGKVLELAAAPRNFSTFRYTADGESYGLQDYLDHNEVAGLLVIKNGKILLEHYGFGNDENSRWVTFSVAKSVVSMLTGAALKDGYIRSLDDKVTDYLPQLKGSSYDQVSIRNMLQMASGVEWNEDYADPESDVANIPENVLEMFQFLGGKGRAAAPGEKFNYNTGESNLAGAVLRAAIGNNLATYLSHKIWRPFGMEADATWLTHQEGHGERGGCCISATLRDYGRLGLFAMGGGRLPDGTSVLADHWMEDSVRPSKGNPGYGYLWWLNGDGAYRALGIFGQSIYINPAKDLVVVSLGAWNTAVGEGYSAHREGFLKAVDGLF